MDAATRRYDQVLLQGKDEGVETIEAKFKNDASFTIPMPSNTELVRDLLGDEPAYRL